MTVQPHCTTGPCILKTTSEIPYHDITATDRQRNYAIFLLQNVFLKHFSYYPVLKFMCVKRDLAQNGSGVPQAMCNKIQS